MVALRSVLPCHLRTALTLPNTAAASFLSFGTRSANSEIKANIIFGSLIAIGLYRYARVVAQDGATISWAKGIRSDPRKILYGAIRGLPSKVVTRHRRGRHS